jgi:hypothetical protein
LRSVLLVVITAFNQVIALAAQRLASSHGGTIRKGDRFISQPRLRLSLDDSTIDRVWRQPYGGYAVVRFYRRLPISRARAFRQARIAIAGYQRLTVTNMPHSSRTCVESGTRRIKLETPAASLPDISPLFQRGSFGTHVALPGPRSDSLALPVV